MKKFFQKQLETPKDVLRVLVSAAMVSAFFGLVIISRAYTDAERENKDPSLFSIFVGLYLLINFSGIALAAYGKFRSHK